MTLEERVAFLEKNIDFFEFGEWTDTVTGVKIPYVKTKGRVGIMSDFWCKKNVGQGAGVSIGTEIDRYGLYSEIDGSSCPDHPSVAVFASALAPNGQPNHAFEGTAGNGSENRGLVLAWGDLVLIFRREGMELLNNWTSYALGKVGGIVKILWP